MHNMANQQGNAEAGQNVLGNDQGGAPGPQQNAGEANAPRKVIKDY